MHVLDPGDPVPNNPGADVNATDAGIVFFGIFIVNILYCVRNRRILLYLQLNKKLSVLTTRIDINLVSSNERILNVTVK